MIGLDLDKIMKPITDMNTTLVTLMTEMNTKLDDILTELKDMNSKS